MSRRLLLTVASAFALATNGQPMEYNDDNYQQDYSQDGLYADYARQQQAKDVAGKAWVESIIFHVECILRSICSRMDEEWWCMLLFSFERERSCCWFILGGNRPSDAEEQTLPGQIYNFCFVFWLLNLVCLFCFERTDHLDGGKSLPEWELDGSWEEKSMHKEKKRN